MANLRDTVLFDDQGGGFVPSVKAPVQEDFQLLAKFFYPGAVAFQTDCRGLSPRYRLRGVTGSYR